MLEIVVVVVAAAAFVVLYIDSTANIHMHKDTYLLACLTSIIINGGPNKSGGWKKSSKIN